MSNVIYRSILYQALRIFTYLQYQYSYGLFQPWGVYSWGFSLLGVPVGVGKWDRAVATAVAWHARRANVFPAKSLCGGLRCSPRYYTVRIWYGKSCREGQFTTTVQAVLFETRNPSNVSVHHVSNCFSSQPTAATQRKYLVAGNAAGGILAPRSSEDG